MDRDADLRPAPSRLRPGAAQAPAGPAPAHGGGRRPALSPRALSRPGRSRLDLSLAGLALACLGALGAALPPLPAAAQAATPAQGGPTCGVRAEVVSRLKAKYGETRRGYGLQRGQSVVEVYASSETGSWTIIMSMPSGLACLVAAGENWAVPEIEATEPVGDPA
ncbi:hypothetical protein P2H44_24975 [Albimonas sp. CAU 1670]|uniref:hypothetical protein n=1 Tax=Albimonas sp. CAU 1670 TaxID=3032599 RepID=UPI0023DA4E9D|nr:hypothetical protein [Albimonas sp. CAU 1670]MDF2235819.1 hypothetical protein [Albimonas sp. CAU 1670]